MSDTASLKVGVDCEHLKKLIREVPDFPKKGILFYDITTLLKDKVGFATLIDALSEHYLGKDIDVVLGMEARGFIFGPALAYRLNAGFVPVRKPGKLPAATAKYDYALEYGTNTLEIAMRLKRASAYSSAMTCWRPAAPRKPPLNLPSRWEEKSPGWALWSNWISLILGKNLSSTMCFPCFITISKAKLATDFHGFTRIKLWDS